MTTTSVDLHRSARRKYEDDERQIVSIGRAKKGNGMAVTLRQLNHEEKYDVLVCDRLAEPHQELVDALKAFDSVVQKLNELPEDMIESIVIHGLTISYTKNGLRKFSIRASRKLSDGHLLLNNSRPVIEPPSDMTDNSLVFFPKDKLPLIENLRLETLTYVDGTQGTAAPSPKRGSALTETS